MARRARSHAGSSVYGGRATFTFVPLASPWPSSWTNPVPGKSVRPLWCSEIVRTRGSS